MKRVVFLLGWVLLASLVLACRRFPGGLAEGTRQEQVLVPFRVPTPPKSEGEARHDGHSGAIPLRFWQAIEVVLEHARKSSPLKELGFSQEQVAEVEPCRIRWSKSNFSEELLWVILEYICEEEEEGGDETPPRVLRPRSDYPYIVYLKDMRIVGGPL